MRMLALPSLALWFLANSLLAESVTPDDGAEFWTGGGGNESLQWEYNVPKSVIAKVPRWKPSDGPLPLLPHEAYEKAMAAFKTLNMGEPMFQELNLNVSMPLANVVPPYYKILIKGTEDPSLPFIIFLDGTTIVPQITKQR